MAAAFATVADLRNHWAALPTEREEEAAQKLSEASIEVRGLYRDVDARLALFAADTSAENGLDPETVRLVVCRMVKRAMDVSADSDVPVGVESFSFGTGPFQMGGKVLNPDGNIYLSAADKRLLGPSRSRRKAWTIPVGG